MLVYKLFSHNVFDPLKDSFIHLPGIEYKLYNFFQSLPQLFDSGGNELTLSQTTYFRFFQTERVCRRQFLTTNLMKMPHSSPKWQKNTVGKGRTWLSLYKSRARDKHVFSVNTLVLFKKRIKIKICV